MFEAVKRFRARLETGQVCLGSGIALSDPVITEALAPSVDFFWIDLEHSPLNYETLQSHLIAARAGGTAALVRVRGGEIPLIKPVVDMGADGIIVPQVRSAEEVRSVVSACRYTPQGDRGYGPRRGGLFGRDAAEYFATANDNLFVAVQIENVDALEDLDAILATEYLDSIAIGPFDLSASMGHLGEVNHPDVRAAIKTIIEKARAAGKYIGMGMGADEDMATDAAELGVQWIQCGDDASFMIQRAEGLYAGIRGRLNA